MTFEEYEILTEAYKWREFEEERRIHQVAWVHRKVGATDKDGKYIYKEFEKFFDEKQTKRDLGLIKDKKVTEAQRRMIRAARIANTKGRRAK